jgi:hypothetical protein
VYCTAAATAGIPISPYRLSRLGTLREEPWTFLVFVIVFNHSVAVFLILPVVLIVPIAQPLHGNGLHCGVLTPEYGGNAQECVSYRDIYGAGTAVRTAGPEW